MRITTHINKGKIVSTDCHPIRIAIHRGEDRQVLYLLGQSIHPNNWNPATGRAYITKRENRDHKSVADNASAINAAISDAINKAEAICKLYPDEELINVKNRIKEALRPEYKPEKKEMIARSFNEFLLTRETKIDGLGRYGYATRFSVAANSLRKFLDKPDVLFSDITPKMIGNFVEWLVKNTSDSTARGMVKVIKTAYFKAQTEGLCPEGNPFKGIDYAEKPEERTRKIKWIPYDQILKIMDLELTGFRALTRDLFCFQFFANGNRVRDTIQLHVKDIDADGYYHFRQGKTGDLKMVKLPPMALRILSKYPATGHIFFPELDKEKDPKRKYKRCSSMTAQINADLKVIGQLADIPFTVTSHMARHSFAAFFYKKTKDIYLTKVALGHKNITQTVKYLEQLGLMETADKIAEVWPEEIF